MKTCRRCLREFDAHDPDDYSPAREIGELFLDAADPEGKNELCPDCREEMGMLNLPGFGQ
ncbi:MAG: hypothetical protein NTZ24_13500 [Deltaproteobacteria bacterium]|nr:hypothetical protein [Deltaproteobacteria bacterium]